MSVEQKKRVFITGASSGIGMATARYFAERGWLVAVNARRAERLEKLLAELPAGDHLICPGDYSELAVIEAAADQIAARWGGLEAVVNAAGVFRQTTIADTPLDEWTHIFNGMVIGGMLSTRLGIRFMQPGGKIVHVTSIHCEKAENLASAYSMAKAALGQMVRVGALELADRGININAIAPGFIKTEMSIVNGVDETEGEWFKDNYVRGHHLPLKRAGQPEEVASVAYFLAGDGANYMTGQTVFVDGGLTLTF